MSYVNCIIQIEAIKTFLFKLIYPMVHAQAYLTLNMVCICHIIYNVTNDEGCNVSKFIYCKNAKYCLVREKFWLLCFVCLSLIFTLQITIWTNANMFLMCNLSSFNCIF